MGGGTSKTYDITTVKDGPDDPNTSYNHYGVNEKVVYHVVEQHSSQHSNDSGEASDDAHKYAIVMFDEEPKVRTPKQSKSKRGSRKSNRFSSVIEQESTPCNVQFDDDQQYGYSSTHNCPRNSGPHPGRLVFGSDGDISYVDPNRLTNRDMDTDNTETRCYSENGSKYSMSESIPMPSAQSSDSASSGYYSTPLADEEGTGRSDKTEDIDANNDNESHNINKTGSFVDRMDMDTIMGLAGGNDDKNVIDSHPYNDDFVYPSICGNMTTDNVTLDYRYDGITGENFADDVSMEFDTNVHECNDDNYRDTKKSSLPVSNHPLQQNYNTHDDSSSSSDSEDEKESLENWLPSSSLFSGAESSFSSPQFPLLPKQYTKNIKCVNQKLDGHIHRLNKKKEFVSLPTCSKENSDEAVSVIVSSSSPDISYTGSASETVPLPIPPIKNLQGLTKYGHVPKNTEAPRGHNNYPNEYVALPSASDNNSSDSEDDAMTHPKSTARTVQIPTITFPLPPKANRHSLAATNYSVIPTTEPKASTSYVKSMSSSIFRPKPQQLDYRYRRTSLPSGNVLPVPPRQISRPSGRTTSFANRQLKTLSLGRPLPSTPSLGSRMVSSIVRRYSKFKQDNAAKFEVQRRDVVSEVPPMCINDEEFMYFLDVPLKDNGQIVPSDAHADKNSTDLIAAAARGRSDQVVTLLEKSILDVNRRDVNGWTALHHACHQCDVLAVQCLLKHGADPNLKVNNGCDAMQIALWAKQNAAGYSIKSDIITFLVRHRADVNPCTEFLSPLAIAFSIKNPHIVETLLQNGSDPSVPIPHCHLLHVAAILSSQESGWQHIENDLLDLGTSPNISSACARVPASFIFHSYFRELTRPELCGGNEWTVESDVESNKLWEKYVELPVALRTALPRENSFCYSERRMHRLIMYLRAGLDLKNVDIEVLRELEQNCDLNVLYGLHTCGHYPNIENIMALEQDSQEGEDVKYEIARQELCMPTSLTYLAANVVRTHLFPNAYSFAKLNLPPRLREYVTLEQVMWFA